MHPLDPVTSSYENGAGILPRVLGILSPARKLPGRVRMAMSEEHEPESTRPADDLLPEVYDELRRLAAALTQQLRPGQTLQATALVHEAYLRLVGKHDPGWQGRRHFF